jgi:hypothetical protein
MPVLALGAGYIPTFGGNITMPTIIYGMKLLAENVTGIGMSVYLIAAAILLISITISFVSFIAIPIYYLIPARIDKSWFWFTRNR